MNYSYQAVDSVTGVKYAWTSATPDPTGTGYPGPNSPTDILQTNVQSTGGGSGVGWGTTVIANDATYSPTEAAALTGLVIAAGRDGAQAIALPDITEMEPVVVQIWGFDANISPTNVVTITGSGIDTETAFIDATGDMISFQWVVNGWNAL